MEIYNVRTQQLARVVTDIGEFRVWYAGYIDMWCDQLMDWTNLPDTFTAEQEGEIRMAGFKAMGKL